MVHGVAAHKLEEDFDAYFKVLDGQARRNYRKALKKGFTAQRIKYNDYLDDVREILCSTDTRQGKMPEDVLKGKVKRNTNPPTESAYHDYPFYGVLKEGKVYAYAGCFVAGEVCMLETIYGHADFLNEGIVPLLIIFIAEDIYKHYPHVKYYAYGKFFGAGDSMRRFLRRFRFDPLQINWELG